MCPQTKIPRAPQARRRTSGTAAVELALSLPLLISLTLGTLKFGHAYFVYSELEQSVRSAARYASLRQYRSATSTPDAAYLTAVRNMAVYGDPAGGTDPIAPGLTTANVAVTMIFVSGVPSALTVAINGYNLPQIIGTVTLTNKPYVKFPYLGIFQPL
jgi:Flp pilus assembly protein TadG